MSTNSSCNTHNAFGKLITHPQDATARLVADAEAINLPRIDEATAVTRPENLGVTYLETEYEALADQQDPAWAAEGEATARQFSVEAEGLAVQAYTEATVLAGQVDILHTIETRYRVAVEVLRPITRREPYAKAWYVGRWFALVIGDIAGISGAAILLGEITELAVIQAVSAGVATVTAGVVGADVKDWRMALRRQRDPKALTSGQQEYAHLFTGPDKGLRVVKALLGVAATIGVLVATSIYALRTSVEGSLSGLVFGGLAGAIALASFMNAYAYADEFADQIDVSRHDLDRARRTTLRLAAHRALKRRGALVEQTRSIRAEYQHRGIAAAFGFTALLNRALRGNPGVVGHGRAPESTMVGRRRTDGGAR